MEKNLLKEMKKTLASLKEDQKKIEVEEYAKKEKIHLAYWHGFHLCREFFFSILDNHEFDFSSCTDTDQICKLIKQTIIKTMKEELKINV